MRSTSGVLQPETGYYVPAMGVFSTTLYDIRLQKIMSFFLGPYVPFLIFFELFYERHILVLSFVI